MNSFISSSIGIKYFLWDVESVEQTGNSIVTSENVRVRVQERDREGERARKKMYKNKLKKKKQSALFEARTMCNNNNFSTRYINVLFNYRGYVLAQIVVSFIYFNKVFSLFLFFLYTNDK